MRKVNADGFMGKACRGGCQSHLTLVDGRDIDTAFPLRGHIDPATFADELVTFEGAQALSVFVFLYYVRKMAAVILLSSAFQFLVPISSCERKTVFFDFILFYFIFFIFDSCKQHNNFLGPVLLASTGGLNRLPKFLQRSLSESTNFWFSI